MVSPASPHHYLPFEEDLKQFDEQIRKLEDLSKTNRMDLAEEIASLRGKREEFLRKTYSSLGSWERIQVSRHIQRPQTRDYTDLICG